MYTIYTTCPQIAILRVVTKYYYGNYMNLNGFYAIVIMIIIVNLIFNFNLI